LSQVIGDCGWDFSRNWGELFDAVLGIQQVKDPSDFQEFDGDLEMEFIPADVLWNDWRCRIFLLL